MQTAIRTIERTSEEYRKLLLACEMFRMQNPGYVFSIHEGYYDRGAGTMWTSIVATKTDEKDRTLYSSFWVLYPRAQEQIVNAANVVEIALAVRDANPDKMGRRDYTKPAKPMKLVQKLVHRVFVMDGHEQEAIEHFKAIGGEVWFEDETEYYLEEE